MLSGRVLVVTADDFGLTAATSRAIIDAHERGIVTAVSVLGNGPATDATLPLLADHPALEVGVHVALVGEDPPLSPASSIPTLVDRSGRLRTSWRRFVVDLAVGRIDPADVRRELDAQVEVVATGQRPIRHLNMHQHLQLWPLLGTVCLDAAHAHGIGYVRTPGSASLAPRGLAIRGLTERLRRGCAERAVATTESFAGLDEAGRWDVASLVAAIHRGAGASREINVHPGSVADPDRERYRWGYRWGQELAALRDPAVREAVGEAGYRLAGPSALLATGT